MKNAHDKMKECLKWKIWINMLLFANAILIWCTQSRITGAVRGAHSQLWGTIIIIPVCSPYAPRKYDRRFGTPAIA